MGETLKVFVAGLVTFVAVDVLWIGVVANGFYKRELGPLARRAGDDFDPRWAPAALLYLLVVVGLLVFVLPRARAGGVADAALWGGLFGIVLYGVYDLTNYATLNGFSLRMTVVDLLWGGVLCAIAASVMHAVRAA
jgi:uncharacterized membrane protein